jgi:hypothetical protein
MAGTIVICFTDIVDSTALQSRLGDEAMDDLRRARRLAEPVGMPGWIERLDRLESGDLEPWRLEQD